MARRLRILNLLMISAIFLLLVGAGMQIRSGIRPAEVIPRLPDLSFREFSWIQPIEGFESFSGAVEGNLFDPSRAPKPQEAAPPAAQPLASPPKKALAPPPFQVTGTTILVSGSMAILSNPGAKGDQKRSLVVKEGEKAGDYLVVKISCRLVIFERDGERFEVAQGSGAGSGAPFAAAAPIESTSTPTVIPTTAPTGEMSRVVGSTPTETAPTQEKRKEEKEPRWKNWDVPEGYEVWHTPMGTTIRKIPEKREEKEKPSMEDTTAAMRQGGKKEKKDEKAAKK